MSRNGKRKPARRILWLATAILAAVYLLSSFGCGGSYCCLCASRGTVYCFCPVTRHGPRVHLGTTTTSTPLSRVLAPMLPGGSCQHQWVRVRRARFLYDELRRAGVVERGTSRYSTQLRRASDVGVTERLAWLGIYDKELPPAIAARLLDPSLTAAQAEAEFMRFATAPIPLDQRQAPRPVQLRACRKLYGLE